MRYAATEARLDRTRDKDRRRSCFRGLKNGALLRAASADFDVLITVDRNLPFQQNVARLEIAVVILISQGTTYPDLKPLVPALLASLDSTKPGEVLNVEGTT